ncbi:cytochrome b561, DM13 and DOMON domain-containing protein At5g54830 [Impatiens glandulifera]|uniref:cytochrome b561, DM13 and DOMON domain-containing protein At5g54830 n=1 Tax=Impatiens glandulifera TaxID=253017 RepID=UPI001FB107BD|nr:cytochrome b561, DM13 and DOMON domain-containing protein At5g54830 [Impatiens glandulifera]
MARALPLFVFLLFLWFTFGYSDPGYNCSKTNTSFIGYKSEFVMVQHQLRGFFELIDDCSFKVTQFDMLQGADAYWWGAGGDDFGNLTSGFVISDMKLNTTYKNETFVVKLMENITWDNVKVVGVWDIPFASDFGHVVLDSSLRNGSNDSVPSAPASGNLSNWGFEQPTMFDNCKVLTDNFRVRWTLHASDNLIDIGLEAAIGVQNYLAFGWSDPSLSSDLTPNADITVTGFSEEGMPFADDFFVTKYVECTKDEDGNVQGVCPDMVYAGSDPDSVDQVNNTVLVYGHRKDGVSFVRFQKPLTSVDKKYDVPLNQTDNITTVWVIGLIKPPDSIHPYYLPQSQDAVSGHQLLNFSQNVNDCLGPLDALDKEDQEIVIADGKSPIVVTTGPALHYPNPPNPSKVFYINKKEAPILRVERGVPVTFSIQAGHDVPLYITSDPLGGNATLRNMSEIIYAGGYEAQGVQASPMELEWAPDRNTPDQVYYHSVYTQKMGWKVQVVDGGLSDMYNSSVILDDQQVTLFWTLSENSISFAARAERKSGYLAIGFGTGMVNSFAYVGWIDGEGKAGVSTYWIDGKDASMIHPTYENLTYVRCKSESGIITLEFTRPLDPSCKRNEKPECKNIIEPTTPVKVVWAMGTQWSEENLSERNMHSATSSRPVRVHLMRGSAEAEEDLRPVLAVHGFMMFLAWGILLPAGILSARYLKHLKGDGWFQLHVYLQYSGLAIILLGFLFAVAELQGLHFESFHVKFGMFAIMLACIQPLNAYIRPKKPEGEQVSSERVLWEYVHLYVGRSSIFAGAVALISGLKQLGRRYNDEDVHGLTLALIGWISMGCLIVVYLEYRERRRSRERIVARNNWVFGNVDEDVDLLHPGRTFSEKETDSSQRMEIQLEPLSR